MRNSKQHIPEWRTELHMDVRADICSSPDMCVSREYAEL